MTLADDVPSDISDVGKRFIDALYSMALVALENTMTKKPIISVLVDQGFGMALGIAPGSWMDVMTPGGYYVRVKSHTLEPWP